MIVVLLLSCYILISPEFAQQPQFSRQQLMFWSRLKRGNGDGEHKVFPATRIILKFMVSSWKPRKGPSSVLPISVERELPKSSQYIAAFRYVCKMTPRLE